MIVLLLLPLWLRWVRRWLILIPWSLLLLLPLVPFNLSKHVVPRDLLFGGRMSNMA